MNWTEKYRPRRLKDYMDSLGIYDPIIRWVRDWSGEHTERRFAILHGKPGTGKTTIVEAIANDLDCEIYITNASDDRNRDDIIAAWQVSTTRSMLGNKRLIVLDEADHISNNKVGRGKSAQSIVLEMINNSKYPVILVCNDLYALDRSIRSAKPFRFRFDYPRRSEKIELARRVNSSEGLKLTPPEIENIVDSSRTFRSLLYNLQKASLGVFTFEPDVVDQDIFEEFFHILVGESPEDTNFKPDELMKWMVEYVPNESDKMILVNNILGRISGERYTTDMHEYAWKFSNHLLRMCRGNVDTKNRTVNGMKVKLPFDSMISARKIKKEIEDAKPKVKAEKTKKVKSRSKTTSKPKVEENKGLSQFF